MCVREHSVTSSRGCLGFLTLGVTVIIFSVWFDSQPSRLFPLQTFFTHFSELFCFLRALTMSLSFSQSPRGFSSLFILDADCCLQNSLTLFLYYLPALLSPKSQQYVVWNGWKDVGKKTLAVHFFVKLATLPLLVCTYSPGSCKLNKEFWVRACLGYICDPNLCTQAVGIYMFDRHFHKQFFSFLTLMSSHIAFICITVNTCPDRKLQAGIFIYNRWHKAGAWWIGVWLLN